MAEIEVVVAHSERATLRVGDLFLKIDADPIRLEAEAEVMALVPVPTPTIRWQQPNVLALAALAGHALGHLGEASSASAAAWAAAGAAVRTLHDAPLPQRPAADVDTLAAKLAEECAWLTAHDVLPPAVIARNRALADGALRPYQPVFAHGDLQVDHVFVDGDTVTGVLDWSEAGRGDALFDLAILTLGHPDRLGDVIAGYGRTVDREVIRGWWSWRALTAARWLIEHGFDPAAPGCEFAVLHAQL